MGAGALAEVWEEKIDRFEEHLQCGEPSFVVLVRCGIPGREGRVSGAQILFPLAGTPRHSDPYILALLTCFVFSGACFRWPGSVFGRPCHVFLMPGAVLVHRVRHLFQYESIGLYVLSVWVACGMGGVDSGWPLPTVYIFVEVYGQATAEREKNYIFFRSVRSSDSQERENIHIYIYIYI